MNRVFLVLLIFISFPSFAGGLEVREDSSAQGRFRTVFAWDSAGGKVAYEVSQISSGGVEVAFNREAEISGGSAFDVATTDPLRVVFHVASGQNIAHFALGNRVFIDVLGGGLPKQKAKQSKAKPKAKKTAPKQEIKKVDGKKAQPPQHASPLLRAEKEKKDKTSANKATKHVIGFASTTALHMAVFKRNSKLWIVVQPKDALTAPQVSVEKGAKRTLPQFTSQGVDDAQLWSTKLTPNEYIHARGGGLSWEISVDSNIENAAPTPPIEPKVVQDKNSMTAVLLSVPDGTLGEIANVPDSLTGGRDLIVVPSLNSAQHFDVKDVRRYMDFDILPCIVGLAIRPKVDDLSVDLTKEGLLITRPSGLVVLNQDADKKASDNKALEGVFENNIYHFKDWLAGPASELSVTKNEILGKMHDLPPEVRVEGVLTLARMYLAHGRGSEALGMLHYAQMQVPALSKTVDFLAWRGAARVLARRNSLGFADLSSPMLDEYEEIKYWRAFALANLEDWRQAAEVLPFAPGPLPKYPQPIKTRLALVLAEVALRNGDVDKGRLFLDVAEVPDSESSEDGAWSVSFDAAREYLMGEVARQGGDSDLASSHWAPLANGLDNRYRTKATLAMTRLLSDEGDLSPEDAIDHLEQVRYIWRGDGLEAQVLFWLGRMYFEAGQHIKSLTLMRRAAAIVPDTDLASEIVGDMYSMFEDLFVQEGRLEALSPMEAAALYEQFGELVPSGDKGDEIVGRLADHLIAAGLYERGAKLLEGQIEYRLKGDDAKNAAIRLAGVYLLSNEPDKALTALKNAKTLCKNAANCKQEIALLHARALSQKNDIDGAMKILSDNIGDTQDAARARADVAWRAQDWIAAADALDDLLRTMGAQPDKPMDDEWPDIILRLAVALRLSDKPEELAQLRAIWGDAMADLPQGVIFAVVSETRDSHPMKGADAQQWRDAIGGVDLFGEFLDRYKEPSHSPPP